MSDGIADKAVIWWLRKHDPGALDDAREAIQAAFDAADVVGDDRDTRWVRGWHVLLVRSHGTIMVIQEHEIKKKSLSKKTANAAVKHIASLNSQ